MDLHYKVAFYTAIYGIVGALISYLVFDLTIMYSFVLGLMVSMLNHSLLIKSVRKSFDRIETKRRSYLLMHQILRLGIFAVILYITTIDERFSLIGTFVGMLSIKIVYMIYILIRREV